MAATCAGATAQSSYTVSNDRLSISIEKQGGAFKSLYLLDDTRKRTPLSSTHGHFLCADAFGPPSKEERDAGFPSHGEAHLQEWTLDEQGKAGRISTLKSSARLPLAGERFSRTVRVVDGEQVVYVSSTLENLTPIDRPVVWQEHATLGAPFLAPGKAVIDVSAQRAMTRPPRPGMANRFKPGQEFTWPMAPSVDGPPIDLRQTPASVANSITTQLMPRDGLAYATALNLDERLLIGWVFRGNSFPWLQNWESYAADGQLYRGLEFGLTAFGSPRREIVSMGKLMDTPLYSWLPAKGKIEAGFLIFLTRAPERMRGVDRITMDRGELLIEDLKAGVQVRLAASLPW
jgi:hypothetical protein